MENKNTGILILTVILSFLVLGLGGFIVFDKLLKDNDNNIKDTTNNSTNLDNSHNLEETFKSISSKKSDEEEFYLDKCIESLKGNFCTIINLNRNYGIYFIKNDNLYFGDLENKKLYEISNLDEVPMKVIYGNYYSDASYPIIGVLTNKGIGYISSVNIETDSNYINKLINFTKIEANNKLSDLALLQNYEVYRGENAPMSGSGMLFAKIGYEWSIVNKDTNGKFNLGELLSNLEVSDY